MHDGPPGYFNTDERGYLRHFSYAMDWVWWPFLLASRLTQPHRLVFYGWKHIRRAIYVTLVLR